MAIGRDIYLDTRLIISKLEERFPPTAEHRGISTPETVGLATLLQKFAIEGSVFQQGVKLIPPEFPLLQHPNFFQDRAGFLGDDWKLDDIRILRPEGIVHMRQCFEIAESLFTDEREWVAGTKELSLADLEGMRDKEIYVPNPRHALMESLHPVSVWSFDWLLSDLLPPKEYFSEKLYPRVYSWRDRFRAAVETARTRGPQTVSLQGDQAVKIITEAGFSDKDPVVDADDPLELKANTHVEVFPTDGGGLTHQDRGRLVQLTKEEVAIAVQAKVGGQEMRIHAPRWAFRVRTVQASTEM